LYLDHVSPDTDNDDNHDFDATSDESNRFAAILLYLTDVEDGGETVFFYAQQWYIHMERKRDMYSYVIDSSFGHLCSWSTLYSSSSSISSYKLVQPETANIIQNRLSSPVSN
jgi:hypothetical protein